MPPVSVPSISMEEGIGMPTAVEPVTDEREALFRRTMAAAADIVWGLGYEHEALSALHDVIEFATVQREAGEDRRGDVSE
jgi:hypothetical protein